MGRLSLMEIGLVIVLVLVLLIAVQAGNRKRRDTH
jgi:hypothetical protein